MTMPARAAEPKVVRKDKKCRIWGFGEPRNFHPCLKPQWTLSLLETCQLDLIRPYSVYCLVDELRQGSFCSRRREKKNKIFFLAHIGGKNEKYAGKLVFYQFHSVYPLF